jgi:drug/metabolite transporter (DMT)-like permease
MSFREQLDKIAPLAGCFALSVAMGNMSLKYIYPSFNQMLGATSPLITVFMAVIMQGKRYNLYTWISMPIICGGLLVCSTKEVNFDALGAFLAFGATVLRAVKSLIQGKLLTEKLDSVSLLYYMAPWSALLLAILSIVAEGFEPISVLMLGFVGANGVANVISLLILSGLNACLLNVSNFLVTSYTSAVTLQVLGNVKSCLSIGISVAIFKNELLWEQAVGVVTCLVGVWYYNKYGGLAKAVTPSSPPPARATEMTNPAQIARGGDQTSQAA